MITQAGLTLTLITLTLTITTTPTIVLTLTITLTLFTQNFTLTITLRFQISTLTRWTAEEDERLVQLLLAEKRTQKQWKAYSQDPVLAARTVRSIKGRYETTAFQIKLQRATRRVSSGGEGDVKMYMSMFYGNTLTCNTHTHTHHRHIHTHAHTHRRHTHIHTPSTHTHTPPNHHAINVHPSRPPRPST